MADRARLLGPMITPSIRGGHEVCQPVAVAGAEVGDAIAIRILHVEVDALAAASGTDVAVEGRYNGDPYCAAVCPGCGAEWTTTRVTSIGQSAVRCAVCGADASPFQVTNGYTLAFDEEHTVGVTLSERGAISIAGDARRHGAIPAGSQQNSILAFALHDLVGVATRLRPFLGQIGTSPSITLPDSHNAGDFGSSLVGAPHRYAVTADELRQHKTDGHLDVNAVRAGSILICPVKLPGAGVYLGDMHAMQGDGEIAGHTADVAGSVVTQVEVLKGVSIDGPILFPVPEDLPFLAQPLNAAERVQAERVARRHGITQLESSLPVSVIGSGPDLNTATENGLARAAALLGLDEREVANRATITGAIEIGRHPGVIRVTFRAPTERLESAGILAYAMEQYGQAATGEVPAEVPA